MNIVILGAPASGKGTYSDYLKKKYNLITYTKADVVRAIAEIKRARDVFFWGNSKVIISRLESKSHLKGQKPT